MRIHFCRAAVAAAFLLSGAAARAQAPERWVSDEQGCKHANAGKPGASVSWTGGCVDGLAEGTGTQRWSLSGVETTVYIGSMAAGLHQGPGLLRPHPGVSLEGNFVKGQLSGPLVFTRSNGQRSEINAPGRLAWVPGASKGNAVCARMASPQVPAVDWKGHAAYRAQAVVKAGRITSIEVTSLQSGVPREVQRRLVAAITAAMTGYECAGDHVFEQQFDFNSGD